MEGERESVSVSVLFVSKCVKFFWCFFPLDVD